MESGTRRPDGRVAALGARRTAVRCREYHAAPVASARAGAAVLESAGGRDLGLLFEELSESGRQSRLLRVAHAHVAQPLVFGRVELLCEQVSEHVLSRESSHHDGSVVDELSDLVVADVDVPELSRLRVDAAFEVGPSESVKRRVGG